ncbi:MAG: helix-turn-helix transcriptional regulator [Chitinophagales bacterium]|jgi:transcriptional regulator with XRE-family HTH domain|nr:helix-turn-helix transcriptional regulator [Chitinophagales bacterium]HPH87473.1 helix-turn-helix domain-containing protein [Chitinophagales bacterium]
MAKVKICKLDLIASKLKQMRIDAGFTSYENFANAKDLDRKQYWRIENGANITISTLIKLLEIHEVTLKEFFSDIE